MNNYREVLELYPDGAVAKDMITSISEVISYLQQGCEWQKRNVSSSDFDEYAEMVAFAQELRTTAEQMTVTQSTGLIIRDDQLVLNLEPWIKFLDKYGLEDIQSKMTVLKDTMIQYLNDSNIQPFKSCIATISRWEFTLNLMS